MSFFIYDVTEVAKLWRTGRDEGKGNRDGGKETRE
jgi:hypothetical protein